MTATPVLPVRDHAGDALTELCAGDEADLDLSAEPSCPLALVVLASPEGVLFGRNRWRKVWELPGGIIESDETARGRRERARRRDARHNPRR